ncbi:MAG TPA: indole-3-glycerol-phosphate synthase [Methanotrichaceae archaeon]|nr:indole-3-glycerol-phosphate synthase [Methanotrichaceae archaeon]
MIEGFLANRNISNPVPSGVEGQRRDLVDSARSLKARGLIPIIAEIKPRILGRPLVEGEVAVYAGAYASGSACAISVLTEPGYFMGSLKNVAIARREGLPVLRKDFITDMRQIREVYADLILLIAALPIDLQGFISEVRSFGSEPMVEVHTDEELERALNTDARIIGINNRNLSTLELDLATFEHLAPRAREAGAFLIAESGVHTRADAMRMVEAGADALLVGTSLMENPSTLAELNGFKLC